MLLKPLLLYSLWEYAHKRTNDTLPEDLKVDKPIGHSGRNTFLTESINVGVYPIIVAKACKKRSKDN